MKIVRPYARIVNPEILSGSLRVIEYAARISHGSEDAQTEDSAERFIRAVVLQHGDWSVVEHVSASVEFLVDRGITHEIVRHRIASYTQSSTRFINYAKKMPPTFIYPKPEVECPLCAGGDQPRYSPSQWGNWLHGPVDSGQACTYDGDWLGVVTSCEKKYCKLLEKGWRPQEARSVFPNALSSKIMMTCNLRSWRHVMLLRTTLEAHPQMRQVMIPLLSEFKNLVPVLFEDIEPEARQIENLRKPK